MTDKEIVDKFSLELLNSIKQGLEHLKKKRANEKYGICFNLFDFITKKGLSEDYGFAVFYQWVADSSIGWPDHSGIGNLPVVEPKIVRFRFRVNLWKGERLKSRLSLIDYLLERITQQIKIKKGDTP